jgi:hypothetical protein
MWLPTWRTPPKSAPPRRRAAKARPRPARHKLSLEQLEYRCLLSAAPLPIPGGFVNPTGGPFVHLNLPGPADAPPPNPPTGPLAATNDPAMIFDFIGNIAVAQVHGTGIGTDTTTGKTSTLFFETDLRYMQGTFIGVDGQSHFGTFALV